MAKSKQKAAASVSPWWLSEGDHECPHCGHLYIYELEFRCPDCDGPGCPHCRHSHPSGRLICTACLASAAEQGDGNG